MPHQPWKLRTVDLSHNYEMLLMAYNENSPTHLHPVITVIFQQILARAPLK